jgi:hypothetical protein
MKYRVLEIDNKFYPQYRPFWNPFWSCWKRYIGTIEQFFSSYDSAKEFIDEQIEKARLDKLAKIKTIHKVKL